MRNRKAMLQDLVQQAKKAGRDPIKVHFNDHERALIRQFIERNKKDGTPRKASFLKLCDLLGKELKKDRWAGLFAANKVNNMQFLVGGHRVRSDREHSDWTNKCFGLTEIKPDVFVVGLNETFFSNASVADLLIPDQDI